MRCEKPSAELPAGAALGSKLLRTPRFLPPVIFCFSCVTSSSILALGYPSNKKRLFQPHNHLTLGLALLLLLSAGALYGFTNLHQCSTYPL